MSSVPGPTLASGLPLLAGVPDTHAFLQARDLEVKHHLCACLLPYLPLSLLNLSPSGLHPQPGWSTIISPSQPSGTAPVSQGPSTQPHSSVPSWAGFVLSLCSGPPCLPTVLRTQIQVMYAPACLDVTVTSSCQPLFSGLLPLDLPPCLKFIFVQKLLTHRNTERGPRASSCFCIFNIRTREVY